MGKVISGTYPTTAGRFNWIATFNHVEGERYTVGRIRVTSERGGDAFVLRDEEFVAHEENSEDIAKLTVCSAIDTQIVGLS
jgi:uncharacterized cupin superfamily protein